MPQRVKKKEIEKYQNLPSHKRITQAFVLFFFIFLNLVLSNLICDFAYVVVFPTHVEFTITVCWPAQFLLLFL